MAILSMSEAQTATAGSAATLHPQALGRGVQYYIQAITGGIWFRITSESGDPAVVNGAGSHYLGPGEVKEIAALGKEDNGITANTSWKPRVSIIRDTVDARVVIGARPNVSH
jgi:hypothetical protein